MPAELAEEMAAGAELAQLLASTSPGQLDDFHLAGVAAAWHRLAAWAQACELATVAEIAARSAARDSSVPVSSDGAPEWVPSEAADEVALALCMSRLGASWWVGLAATLSWRLPATMSALRAGEIDFSRAKLIAESTSVLDDEGARAVQDKVLSSAGRQTLGQLRAALRRAVISVDPQAAERRREQAERNAKVGLYGDEDGTATLAGHNLPGAQSAAAMARITALAKAMKAAGADGGVDLLRAKAYLGLLLGTLPLIPPAEGPEPGPSSPPGSSGPGRPDPGPDVPSPPGPATASPRPSLLEQPDRDQPVRDQPDRAAPGSARPCTGEPTDPEPVAPERPSPADGGRSGWNAPWPDLPVPGEDPAPGCAPAWPSAESTPPDALRPTGKVTLSVTWPTLAGLSGEPGSMCWLGPVTPGTARTLVAAAAADPFCLWQVVLTGRAGDAVAVRRFRIRRKDGWSRRRAGNPSAAHRSPGSPRAGLIGRVTVIVPVAFLSDHGASAYAAHAGSSPPAESAVLADVLLAALDAARAAFKAAPGRAECNGPPCDHRSSSPAYRPPERLREFIAARDQTCRFPGCRQPAWRADQDHTVAFDQGGRTCSCNLGSLCRRHHQLKQHRDWRLEQPTPGTFIWTPPSGRKHRVTPPSLWDPEAQRTLA